MCPAWAIDPHLRGDWYHCFKFNEISSLVLFAQPKLCSFSVERRGYLSFSLRLPSQRVDTVKLGLYAHDLVRTLGHYVFSVDHGHRQSHFSAPSLFWIKRTLFRTYLFSFPLRYVITESHCTYQTHPSTIIREQRTGLGKLSLCFNKPSCASINRNKIY